jgi:hypothetical protein
MEELTKKIEELEKRITAIESQPKQVFIPYPAYIPSPIPTQPGIGVPWGQWMPFTTCGSSTGKADVFA